MWIFVFDVKCVELNLASSFNRLNHGLDAADRSWCCQHYRGIAQNIDTVYFAVFAFSRFVRFKTFFTMQHFFNCTYSIL